MRYIGRIVLGLLSLRSRAVSGCVDMLGFAEFGRFLKECWVVRLPKSIYVECKSSNPIKFPVASKLKTVPTGYDPSSMAPLPVDLNDGLTPLFIDHESNNLQRMHRPRRQLMHLLTKVFFRWMVTFILIVCQYSTMLSYERRGVLTKFDKTTFNFVKTGLYLSIGLNVAGSFKSMALMLRWKLLSRKKHSLDEVDAILGLASLLKVVGLGARSLKKKKFHVFFWSLLWIIVNLVSKENGEFVNSLLTAIDWPVLDRTYWPMLQL